MKTEYSPYRICQNIRLHKDLYPMVERMARENGLTVPKQLVLILDQRAPLVGPDYQLNGYLDVFALTTNPRENNATQQIKLYMQEKTVNCLARAALELGVTVRELRNSLLLDCLESRDLRLS